MVTLLVQAVANNAKESPDKWRPGAVVLVVPDGYEFSVKELPQAGKFYHINVTNRTYAEASGYFDEDWTHKPTVTQISKNGNNRLIEVVSQAVSASGKNAFTQAMVQPMFDKINEIFPTADAQYVSHTQTSFRFSLKVPATERDVIVWLVNQMAANIRYRKNRWTVNPAGMAYLAANGGTASGTAAQVAQYLEDGYQT